MKPGKRKSKPLKGSGPKKAVRSAKAVKSAKAAKPSRACGRPKGPRPSEQPNPSALTPDGIPATIVLPMTLQVESSGADPKDPKTWNIRGAASATTTVEATVAQRAEILTTYRERYRKYGPAALRELLERDPEFIREAWVREAVIQLMHEGRFDARLPHRPPGRSPEVLSYGLALVGYVDDRVAKTGESLNSVFKELGEAGFASLGYEGIRALYRRTKSDDRLKPYLILG